jgi:hypothetical protein
MCFGSQDTPRDNSGDIARQQATERQAAIETGQGQIDKSFGIFDPAYYDKYKQTYQDYYNPQVDQQFGEAKQKLKYGLARSGTTDSTGGQKQFGDLVDKYGAQRENIAAGALDASNKLRTSVEGAKGDLYAQNTASADPALSAISATSRANSLSTPAAYSPLGDIFSGAVNTGTSYYKGTQQGLPSGYASLFTPGSGSVSGSNSVRVVS